MFGCGGISGVLISTRLLFYCAPLHVILKFMPHTAALCCKKQQQKKTPRMQRYTSSLLIPCTHGKLNVKYHRKTPKPDIHITAEKELRWREIRAPKRIQAAQQQCKCVCIQTGPISINPGSMEEAREYGQTHGTCFVARRLEVVAVAGLLWISWCVLSVVGFRLFFFFVFFTSNACGLLQV